MSDAASLGKRVVLFGIYRYQGRTPSGFAWIEIPRDAWKTNEWRRVLSHWPYQKHPAQWRGPSNPKTAPGGWDPFGPSGRAVVTSASLVTSALLVVTMFAITILIILVNNYNEF